MVSVLSRKEKKVSFGYWRTRPSFEVQFVYCKSSIDSKLFSTREKVILEVISQGELLKIAVDTFLKITPVDLANAVC